MTKAATVEASIRRGVSGMRRGRNPQASMLGFVDLEERVPRHHPLRTMKRFADRALVELSPTFDAMYGTAGRPSIPPERDRKSTRLNSSHVEISYAVFCLKKKKKYKKLLSCLKEQKDNLI